MTVGTNTVVRPFQQVLQFSGAHNVGKGQYSEDGGVFVGGGLGLAESISHFCHNTKQIAGYVFRWLVALTLWKAVFAVCN